MTRFRSTPATRRSDSDDERSSATASLATVLLACVSLSAALASPTIAHADTATQKSGDAVASSSARAEARIDEARAKAATLYPTCNKKPSDADLKGAKGSHTAAKEFLERGAYDKAIESWHDAYGFDCSRPSVFYNLGNAYERSGDKAMTVAVLELAVQRDPDADKSTLQAKIENLRAAIASEHPSPSKGLNDHPLGPGPKADDNKPTKPTEGHRPFGPVPWITFGIGGATLVAGVSLLIVGHGNVSDAEKACPTHKGCDQKTQDLGNGGNTLTGAGIGLVAGGGALTIGSLVWQLAANGMKPSAAPSAGPAVTVTPSVSPRLAGAVISGRF